MKDEHFYRRKIIVAIIYGVTRQSTNTAGNTLEITITNCSGTAWGSYIAVANYTFIDTTSTPYTINNYFTEEAGTTASNSIIIELPILTAPFSSDLASNLLVGITYPETSIAIS